MTCGEIKKPKTYSASKELQKVLHFVLMLTKKLIFYYTV